MGNSRKFQRGLVENVDIRGTSVETILEVVRARGGKMNHVGAYVENKRGAVRRSREIIQEARLKTLRDFFRPSTLGREKFNQ